MGHIAERRSHNGECYTCAKEKALVRAQLWAIKNSDKIVARRRSRAKAKKIIEKEANGFLRKDTDARKEALACGATTYFTGKPCPQGHIADRRTHNGECIECARISSLERAKQRYLDNPQEAKDRMARWIEKNPERRRGHLRKYIDKHRDRERKRSAVYRRENHDKVKFRVADWARRNPDRLREKAAYRRGLKRSASPSWLDRKELQSVYRSCPQGYEVDHIIPLNHEYVCGLHIPLNLTYLTIQQNREKGNSFNPDWVWPELQPWLSDQIYGCVHQGDPAEE